MTQPKVRVQLGYTCGYCQRFAEAKSVFEADKPDGYFVETTRVRTGQQRHNPLRHYSKLPEMVYLCNKECFANWVQYSMNSSLEPYRPIGTNWPEPR